MIGIFDSGVGGLSVYREVARLLPRADIIYLADTAFFPYGARSPKDIEKRAESITRALIARGASIVVVACNTATVVAIKHLRNTFPIPFAGVVPPVKVAAAKASETAAIYVLSTQNTASGRKYRELVEAYGDGRTVEALSLPLLARVVEDGSFRTPETAAQVTALLKKRVGKLPPGSIVVLGCSHYVFLQELIKNSLGQEIEVLEPSAAVAAQVGKLLEKNGIPAQESGRRIFLCTGDAPAFAKSVAALLECEPPLVEHLALD